MEDDIGNVKKSDTLQDNTENVSSSKTNRVSLEFCINNMLMQFLG